MLDVQDIRGPAIALGGLEGVDRALTFHYDETNNIRRLLLTPGGLNVRAPQCFVLGGPDSLACGHLDDGQSAAA